MEGLEGAKRRRCIQYSHLPIPSDGPEAGAKPVEVPVMQTQTGLNDLLARLQALSAEPAGEAAKEQQVVEDDGWRGESWEGKWDRD